MTRIVSGAGWRSARALAIVLLATLAGVIYAEKASAGVDTDGDGYDDAQEILLGKNPNVYCAIMRADVNGDHSVDLSDIVTLARHYLEAVPPGPARLEQNRPPDGVIDLSDLTYVAGVFFANVSACP